ncbi:MAG: inorganic phosphate transporter [Acidobacteria bacterium]|nr:inorganic phosphate transporter [Acidobacteriota bacterium]
MMFLLVAAVLLLAFVNGANDNMKGVATLYGTGTLTHRGALLVGTLSTGLGSLLSVRVAPALARAFSAQGLVPDDVLGPGFLAAVAAAAALTVLAATRLGLPVSTTHALVGAMVGAGLIAAGPRLSLGRLGLTFFLPLLLSPAAAVTLAFPVVRAGRAAGRWFGVGSGDCICVGEEWEPIGLLEPGASASVARTRTAAFAASNNSALAATGVARRLTATVGSTPHCMGRYHGRVIGLPVQALARWSHLLSASLVGFARGLNDTPKILGLLAATSLLPWDGALLITLTMALGGIVASRRVGETMANRITPMAPTQGLAANLVTSCLVIGASRLGLPVSTTHVATGGIIGVGSAVRALDRATVASIATAWMTTLPLGAALGAAIASMLL